VRLVDVAQERKLTVLALEDLGTVRTHMHHLRVAVLGSELFIRHHLVVVEVSMKLADHPEVVHKDWVLVDVLENTELSIFQGKLEAIFEVLVCVDNASFLVFALDQLSVDNLDRERDSQGSSCLIIPAFVQELK